MIKKVFLIALVIICFGFTTEEEPAYDQVGFIGEVKLFAGNFAPRGWAFCNGQMLPISNHNALFSILGTTYGGDGRTTFALPDLRGRVAVSPGTGPGLSTYQLGQRGGSEYHIQTAAESPSMSYQIPALEVDFEKISRLPRGASSVITTGSAPNTKINTERAGGNQSMNNVQPFLGVNYIICLNGVYPSRS
ncbi:phage tail protein [Psychroserpens sp.]|uniref:phage tail protein n=1 Tax=Psychroserpens sp. TaxID=2020870 RepID=UPI001B2E679A|nr:tail fiber protein [Psychroserpens sp.]MBO6606873.1 phage tail protein [Psychroserpens sp.]MBO6630598.1 phage tail protein [Psychroserpens sp.]MBO6654019.1 phage tail protein [Psychroserpens sp.]MBO6682695.1 phage tail protein [Psychroserpens sp.]MBO6750645.1 phage tail protein [Psychroserpens sp.]